MMIIDKVIEKLKEKAEIFKLNEYKGLRSLYMKFNIEHEREVRALVSDILGEYVRDGEIIEMIVKSGLFVDMGMETIRIKRGFIWEYYHHPETIHYYIRLLHLTNSSDWIALYIDENPLTPWWSGEERRK
jgi:hypothetical protein